MGKILAITESEIRNLANATVKEFISESIKKQVIKQRVNQIVSETIDEMIRTNRMEFINEDDAGQKRKAVMNMLKDGKYNHAELARKLWHPKDKGEEDTYRSLFSKKATGAADSDGAVRHFDDSEINKLYELLRTR